jgi:hypothetical protein
VGVQVELAGDACPRRLRLAACLSAFVGGISAGAWVMDLSQGVFAPPVVAVLILLTALALLKGTERWRAFLTAAMASFAFLIVAATAIVVARGYRGEIPGDLVVFGDGVALAVEFAHYSACLLAAMFHLWLLRALTAPDVKAWFYQPPGVRARVVRAAWGRLTVAAAAGGLLGVAISYPYLPLPGGGDNNVDIAREHRAVTVHWGPRWDRLSYVVFLEASDERKIRYAVQSDIVNDRVRTVLETPDGRCIRLPNRTQLYEIVDGKFRTSAERVTREEFDAFMRSSPKACTIDALLQFARSRRANPQGIPAPH